MFNPTNKPDPPSGLEHATTLPAGLLDAPLTYAVSYKLAPAGKFCFLGFLFAAFSSTASLEIPIFHFASALAALFLVAVAVGWLFRPRVEIALSLPDRMTAGETVAGALTLRNRSILPIFDLAIGSRQTPGDALSVCPDPVRTAALPGELVSIPFYIRVLRRGLHRMAPLVPYTTFPFALVRTAARVLKITAPGPTALLVLPRFHPLAAVDIPIGARYQPGGVALTSNIGESPEYIGNRDYRPGDSLRRIDFRSWGRLARPVVREYQEEYYCRVALVLDTFVPAGPRAPIAGFADLEAAVSIAAAVADAMARDEYIIDLFAAGPELYVFRSGRHTAHFENVLEILAGVDACRENPFGKVTPALADELNSISAVICVMLDWDDAREQLVRAAAEAGCSVKVLIVRDGPTSRPLASADPWVRSIVEVTPEHVNEGRIDRL